METNTVALPDDLVAGILGRLPARSLAVSRGICKAWHDIIDKRELLLPFVLPHLVRGLFINYQDYERPHFFSRPTSSSLSSDAKFDFMEREKPDRWYEVADHCNGLILFLENNDHVLHVCNPATRWSARLPPCPANTTWNYRRRVFLVFDPFVSPEYKVLLSPKTDFKAMENIDDLCRLMEEWPPLAWAAWLEFSSNTGRWEEKVFIREGEAAGSLGELLLLDEWGFHHVEPPCRYAVYWKGALYVHWRGEFVSRLSLQDDKYRVIKSPVQVADCKINDVRTFLGRSEKGVYIAAIAEDGLAQLRVWSLCESSDQTEWVPKGQSNLRIDTGSWWLMEDNEFDVSKLWTLDLEPKYWMSKMEQDVSLQQSVCWTSDDDDNIVHVSDAEQGVDEYVKFLGFHPYKEIIFLSIESYAVAFHLNSQKIQYLGTVHLQGTYNRGIRESFVYTPCLIGDY